jgi:undecaprenyl-diphosphatase
MFYLAWVFPTFPGDEQALLETQQLRAGWLDTAAVAVSSLGWFPVSVALIATVATLLWLQGHRVDTMIMLLSMAPMGIGNAIKILVDRPRPDHLLLGSMPGGMGFPSGHAIYATVFCGLLIFLAGQLVRTTLLRRCIQIGLAVLVLLMGATRVYLGVHWPSDVIGGYLFGIMALLGLINLRNQLMK